MEHDDEATQQQHRAAGAGEDDDGPGFESTQPPPAPRGPRLTQDGVDVLRLIGDVGDVLTLGRTKTKRSEKDGAPPDLAVPAASTRVSGLHAELRFKRGGWFIVDMNSSLGTTVNGVVVVPGGTQLFDGDIIGLGEGIVAEDELVDVEGEPERFVVKGLGGATRAAAAAAAATEELFNSDERSYAKRVIKAMEMGLERANAGYSAGSFEQVWRAAGSVYVGVERAGEDFKRRVETDERDRRVKEQHSQRRVARFENFDDGRGRAHTARRRDDKKQHKSGGGGPARGGVSKRSRHGRGGGGGGGRGGRGGPNGHSGGVRWSGH